MQAACRTTSVAIDPRRTATVTQAGKKPTSQTSSKSDLSYGNDWYSRTRELSQVKRTVREEIEYRKLANLQANNGKERKDLYTDNWDGSEYKGSPFNILTLLAVLSVMVPVAGLAFAYATYGDLWG